MPAAKRFNVAVTALLATGAVTVVVLSLAMALNESDDADLSTAPELVTPCGGSEVSLAEAGQVATFDLLQPSAPLANANRLLSTWECSTSEGGIALVYDSGVSVLESPSDLKDPAATWQRMADLYEEFSVTEIHGVTVSLADPKVDGALGGADFVIGGVRYTVSGDGKIALDDLLAVAESLAVQAVT